MENKNNKIDGYIQLPKQTSTLSDTDIQKISEYVSKSISPFQKSLQEFAKMASEISKVWMENINNYHKTFAELGKKLKPIFDTIKQNTKISTKMCIENGFYPSPLMKISIVTLCDCKNNSEIVAYLCSRVEFVINDETNKKALKLFFNKYRKILNEIFSLYKKENYRLCILSIINFISMIFNECFDKKDFGQKFEICKKLKEKNHKLEDHYILLAPYFEDNDNKITNTLIKNYRDKPEKYATIPYNRNAIIHGYSKNFGTKTNCLRWFSVIISTFEFMAGFDLYDFTE